MLKKHLDIIYPRKIDSFTKRKKTLQKHDFRCFILNHLTFSDVGVSSCDFYLKSKQEILIFHTVLNLSTYLIDETDFSHDDDQDDDEEEKSDDDDDDQDDDQDENNEL